MATFIALKRHGSDVVIHVNMDKVLWMEPEQKYTILFPESEKQRNIAVNETPGRIMQLIRDEQKH
jgi:hypothetical protein